MGLDQIAYRLKARPSTPVDFNAEEYREGDEETDAVIATWRKHPDLQGWMEMLYRQKGGQHDNFNCVPVLLELADLDMLEADVKDDKLPHTTGFFFGASQYPEDKIADLVFIERARQAIAEGKFVCYTSWW